MARFLPQDLSVVIPSKNEKDLKNTLLSLRSAKFGEKVELIVVDDGSTDGSCKDLFCIEPSVHILTTSGKGVSYARNLGARAARGKILVFCDANLIALPNLFEEILKAFENEQILVQAPYISDIANPDAAGFGMTLNQNLEGVWLGRCDDLTPVPILPSTCLALHSDIYWQVGGFDEGFKILGHEDVELSIRLWLCGHTLYLNPFTGIKHLFRALKPYYFSREHYVYNIIRLACLHFNTARITKTLNLYANNAYLNRLVSETMLSDVWQTREKYQQLKKYDDNWYVEKFKIPF
ncbi:glycosyltransferase [Bacillota bacterium LX-D]|nr:glycosyltransferase [Bacillota bacterium LX-D]